MNHRKINIKTVNLHLCLNAGLLTTYVTYSVICPPPARKKPWSSVVLLGDSETLNGEVWGLVEGRQVTSGATLKDYATNMTA